MSFVLREYLLGRFSKCKTCGRNLHGDHIHAQILEFSDDGVLEYLFRDIEMVTILDEVVQGPRPCRVTARLNHLLGGRPSVVKVVIKVCQDALAV